jgi:tetratricopeptide (TPR) repeat protein
LQRKGQHDAAIRRFLVGKEIADQTRGADLLRAQLNQRLLLAHRVQKADELNKVVQLLRFYALQDQTPRRMQHVLEAAGRRIWAERELLTNQAAGKLDLAAEKNIRSHLQEFVLLWSDLQVRLAPASHVGHVRGEGQKVLTEAERLFGPSLGLTLAQEQHTSFAARERLQPQATWEFCALGRIALAKGDHAEAMRCLQQALELEPLGFVPNFYFGVSALRQQEHEQALQAFSFCLGVDPCAECFLLRGQTQAALGQTDRALQDFNHALAKNPQLGVAYQQRGNLLRESGRVAEAEKDLQMARKLSE